MSTINISLPKQQAISIDTYVKEYGFANRSEFIRTVLRFVLQEKHLVKQATVFPFVSPKQKSVQKIMSSFTHKNTYSKDFLRDLKEGLAQSDYFST